MCFSLNLTNFNSYVNNVGFFSFSLSFKRLTGRVIESRRPLYPPDMADVWAV